MKKKYHTPVFPDLGLKAEKYLFTCRKKTSLYLLLLSLLLIAVPWANIQAEGSGKWKGTQTGRQSSLWVPGNNTGNSGYNTRGSMMRPSAASNYDPNHRFYVYVKAGETVYFSFRSSTSSNLTWYYDNTTAGYNTFFPSGISGSGRTEVTTANSNLQGRTSINTNLIQAQAVAGPSALTSGGYATSGTASSSSSNPGGQFTNNTGQDRAFWVEIASPGNNGFEISEWDVTVASGTTKRPGRVYCKYWSIYNGLPSGTNGQPNTSAYHDNFGFYVPVDNTYTDQTDDYYIKYVNFGRSNAGYAVFFANDSGPLNNFLPNGDPDIEENRKSVKGTSNRYQYPLFVEEPDESIWKTSIAPIASTDVRFRRKADATGGEAYFMVEVDTPGSLDILVDLDNSGDYSTGDVQIFRYFDVPGAYDVYWDGKDGNGNVVPAGTQIKLLTSANFFPVHFPVYDMEQSLGITMKNIRPVDMESATVKLFWDHSKIYTGVPGTRVTNNNPLGANQWGTVPRNDNSTTYADYNVQSPAINTTGADSPGNIWWASGDNGIGNNNTFNVYAGSWMETLELNFTFNWDKSDVEILKTVSNPTPAIGSEVTFTITATNKGLMYAQDITVDDLLPSGYEYVSHTAPMGSTVTPAPIGSNDPETWENTQTTYDPLTGIWTVHDVPYDTDDLSKNKRVLTITAKVLKSGIYNNTAEGYPEVRSSDSNHGNNSSTVVVNPTNSTNAVNDINITFENTPVNGNVLTNDYDLEGHIQTVTSAGSITTAEGGNVQINTDGTYVYTPKENFTGTDRFSYTVCDDVPAPLKACATATVTITVVPEGNPSVNNNVVANDDTGITEQDKPVSGNILSNDFDPDGDNLILNTTPVTPPSHGSVTILPDGTYTYTPDPGFNGTDTFEYEVCDDGQPVTCDRAIVTITVLPKSNINITYANDDVYYTKENEPVSGNVLDNDFDPEGDEQIVNTVPMRDPVYGSVVLNADGTFTYTPNNGFTGTDSFIYEVCDDGIPESFCDKATVYIIITKSSKNYWHGTIDNDWAKTGNWTADHVPQPGENIEFATNANNNGSPAVRDLYLDTDRVIGDLINNSDVDLLVTTENQLTINGVVRDDNPDKGTIVVKTSTDKPTGTLLFANPDDNRNVNASVEFYNKAYECSTCGFYKKQWQYFGIPVQVSDFPYLTPKVETVNQWVETFNGNKWQPAPYTPDTGLKAFKGYEMTNSSNTLPTHIYSFSGTLNVGNAIVPLTRTSNVNYSGMNLVGNSFTAAIPITSAALELGSVELTENTVYLFNTGTRDQWRKMNGGTVNGVAGGQYQAVPFNLAGQAGIPDRILSMHTFMLDVKTPGNITLKYGELIKNELNTSTTNPWKSAYTENSMPQYPYIVMDVISNTSADRVWLFENSGTTAGFDNGWDAYKLQEEGLTQIYVSDNAESKYQIATVPEFTGTTFGVNTVKDENFSIVLSVTSDVETRKLYLYDIYTGRSYPVENNVEYIIQGANNIAKGRFKITESPSPLTGTGQESSLVNIYIRDNRIVVDNQSDSGCVATVYDILGRLLDEKRVIKNSREYFTGNQLINKGVYIVKIISDDKSISKSERVLLK